MTDIPSGLKRTYEGGNEREWKRRREEEEERERSCQKDWRDVHLKEGGQDSSRDKYRDRRGRGGYRTHDRRNSRERERDRERDRDRHRERDRNRDRYRDRDRGTGRDRDRRRSHSRSRSSRPPKEEEKKPSNGVDANVPPKDRDSEMEEGE